jgi:hypothetical protein
MLAQLPDDGGGRLRLPKATHDTTTLTELWLDSSIRDGLLPGVASNAPPTEGHNYASPLLLPAKRIQ